MENGIFNIALCLLSASAVWIFWGLYIAKIDPFRKKSLAGLGILVLLFMPFNVGGNVYTILGSARSENNIFSIFSVYQDAKKDVFAVVNVGYQNAGNTALQGLGLAYQSADNAVQVAGIAYQNTGNNAVQVLGLAYQSASRDVGQIFGLAYQSAGRDALQFFGLAYQNAGRDADQVVGITIQFAGKSATNSLSVALWKQVGEQSMAFALWSTIEAPKEQEK